MKSKCISNFVSVYKNNIIRRWDDGVELIIPLYYIEDCLIQGVFSSNLFTDSPPCSWEGQTQWDGGSVTLTLDSLQNYFENKIHSFYTICCKIPFKIILSYHFNFFTIFLQIHRLVHEEGHVAIPCLHTWKPGTRSQKGPKSWGRRGPVPLWPDFNNFVQKLWNFLSSQAIKIWFNTPFWLVIMVKN